MAELEQDLSQPLRPKALFARCERDAHRIRITRRGREKYMGCVAILFTGVWTFATLFTLIWAVARPDSVSIPFATIFSMMWIGCCVWVLESLCGVEAIEIADGYLHYSKRIAGVSTRDRWISLTQLRGIDVASQPAPDGPPQCFLDIRTSGSPFRIFEYLQQAELEWWRAQLKSFVTESASMMHRAVDRPNDASDTWQPPAHHEILSLASEPVQRPVESRYVLDSDSLVFSFSRRASWSMQNVLSLVSLSIVFTGFASIFLGIEYADGPPNVLHLLVVALPIFAVGFVLVRLFKNLNAALVGPARRIIWTFEQQAIVERLTWFGVGRARTHVIPFLACVELCSRPPGAGMPFEASADGIVHGPLQSTTHVVALRDSDAATIVAISDLTEDEARWIGDCILRARPWWFKSTPKNENV